jgi:hypothetical protein
MVQHMHGIVLKAMTSTVGIFSYLSFSCDEINTIDN